jgi:hypothetical protein
MVIPEIIIHRVLISGLRLIRRDSRVLDSMFRNLDQTSLQELKDFILKVPLAISINWPKKVDLQVPALVLVMKSEAEPGQGGFLGDMMGVSPSYGVPDEEISYDEDSSSNPITDGQSYGLRGQPALRLGPLACVGLRQVSGLTGTQVLISEADQPELLAFAQGLTSIPSMNLHVVSGTGAGQALPLLRITTESLDVEGSFSVQLDSTSVVILRDAQSHGALGEPSKVFSSSRGMVQRLGSIYDASFQIMVLGAEPEHVLYLYAVVKAIFFMHRVLLEEQGLQVLKISGSDLSPRSEFVPDTIYQRVMTLQFTYPFHITMELDVPTVLEFDLDVQDPYTLAYGATISTTLE